jgi:hypothetical protein
MYSLTRLKVFSGPGERKSHAAFSVRNQVSSGCLRMDESLSGVEQKGHRPNQRSFPG